MVQNCADQATGCGGAVGGHASILAQLLYAALYAILILVGQGLSDSLMACPRWPSVFDTILSNLSG
jgi:hypothetical protein